MPATFVHVSDIHFGQERDDRRQTHNDVKKQVIADAAEVVRSLPAGVAHGILLTGDIAFSGTRDEFQAAGEWLDELASAVNCPIFNIQMVPGNHDLDRDATSMGASHLLDVIKAGGAAEFEKVMSNDVDRAALFARFGEYGRFSAGYQCGLDPDGVFSATLHVELAPGRSIRFVRLNSSLLCTGKETYEEPELVVGARQFTIPRTPGEELIVLMHHPYHWLKDGTDVERYVKSRARVLITGHEHHPAVRTEKVEDGCEVLMLAAGATVPSRSNATYTFTYNVIEFDWQSDVDGLEVKIHPRAWSPTMTRFEPDHTRLGGADPTFVLGCPMFRKEPPPAGEVGTGSPKADPIEPIAPVFETLVDNQSSSDSDGGEAMVQSDDDFRLLLLRFFRDLKEGERLLILAQLEAIDPGSDQRMTQAVERKLLDLLVRSGKLDDLRAAVEHALTNKKVSE